MNRKYLSRGLSVPLLLVGGIIVLVMSTQTLANNAYHDAILEMQLRDYSSAHREFQKERTERYRMLEEENRDLQARARRVIDEHMEWKENILELAEENLKEVEHMKRLQGSQAQLKAEYQAKIQELDRLKETLKAQKQETAQMEEELLKQQEQVYEEVRNFYKMEEERLRQKIEETQNRQAEIRKKISQETVWKGQTYDQESD